MSQNGVLFLNSSIGYDDIKDGTSTTLFVVEGRTDMGADLGWMAGTRSSLRNVVKVSHSSPKADLDGGSAQVFS